MIGAPTMAIKEDQITDEMILFSRNIDRGIKRLVKQPRASKIAKQQPLESRRRSSRISTMKEKNLSMVVKEEDNEVKKRVVPWFMYLPHLEEKLNGKSHEQPKRRRSSEAIEKQEDQKKEDSDPKGQGPVATYDNYTGIKQLDVKADDTKDSKRTSLSPYVNSPCLKAVQISHPLAFKTVFPIVEPPRYKKRKVAPPPAFPTII